MFTLLMIVIINAVLCRFPLIPPLFAVNMKFSARYYLNLVLVDEENRRYFKQQEITIFRREGKSFWLLTAHPLFLLSFSHLDGSFTCTPKKKKKYCLAPLLADDESSDAGLIKQAQA